ncbi:MAG: DNA replication/repair protein RecF [Ruminococcaceae bacterium]|nr:DNA replication/repair protein RecF [Oscillospiraceae bacterium]
MRVNRLYIQDFRNYKEAEVTFCPGVNLIYGKNAQGKTNLLEALWLFTNAKSFRTAQDGEMIRFSAESATVKTGYTAFGRDQTAEIILNTGKRKLLRLGGAPLEKTSELLGQFPAVLFSPDELHIITGAPEVRRRFTDSAISAFRPAYYGALRTYLRVWKQKNVLLKNTPEKEALSVWNEQMAQSGAKVMQYRKEFFSRLAPLAAEMHRQVAGKEEYMEVSYAPSVPVKETVEVQAEALFAALEKKRDAEIYAGLSLVGPHRDEMKFTVNGKDARSFASQGQMKTAAVSLKIAQGMLLEEETGEPPAVFLDDILGELDEERRNFLLSNMHGRQIILTCTERDAVKVEGETRYFHVEDGTVCIST